MLSVVRRGVPAAVRRWYKPAVIAALAAATAGLVMATGGRGPGDGFLFDLLVYARSKLLPPPAGRYDSPVAIVAIDQDSLEADELKDRPRALMAPEWARILDGLFAAGVRVVGFDVIFAYSGSQLVPEFDAPMLEALGRHRDRVVLARSESTLPYIAYAAAVGGMRDPERLGMAALEPDADGVFRMVHATIPTGEPTLAAVVLRRNGLEMPPVVRLAPTRHLESIPTYAMADVLRCAKSEPEALAKVLRGKIVMVGGTHPDEDRKLSSSRWLPVPREREEPLARCGLRRLPASAPAAMTVPGVAIHAAALEAVVAGKVTITAPPSAIAIVSALAAVDGAWLGLYLTPWLTAAGVIGGGVLFFLLATGALAAGFWIPLSIPLTALVVAPLGAYVVRYLVEERLRRRIAEGFTLFAPRHLVERLAEDPSALSFGGEERQITVMFADLSGSTELSTRVAPADLVRIVNDHLAMIADAVEETGGYVDKFIGDAVMGLWGAPLAHERHAVAAVRAAILAARAFPGTAVTGSAAARLSVKIGINSGNAIVGLVGTPRRYNYTAVGEVVNFASRLEGVPPIYGCRVVVGETTGRLVAGEILLREVDRVLVKGAAAPLRIFEPIAERAFATPEQQAGVERYAEALALYRARRFEDAAELWEKLAVEESSLGLTAPANPADAMARRARSFITHPPPDDWDAVTVFTTK